MKRLILSIVITLTFGCISTQAFCPRVEANMAVLQEALKKGEIVQKIPAKLILGMIEVESRGHGYDKAINRKELAFGCLQVRQGYVDCINRVYKTNLVAQDCYGNRHLSILMLHAYCTIYGKNLTADECIRIHNKGKAGMNKASAYEYLLEAKVMALQPRLSL